MLFLYLLIFVSDCAPNCLECSKPGTCNQDMCAPAYAYVNSTELCSACSAGCKSCDMNGPLKCDPGKCSDEFAYDASTLTCTSKSVCVSVCQSVCLSV